MAPTTTPDPRLTETVWRRFGGELERFVQRRVDDPHRAEELVGEIIARIHQSLHTVADERHLAAWVYRIARNAITDEYRRRPRRPVPMEDLESAAQRDDPADAWVDDPDAAWRDLAACVRPLLDSLAPAHRRALELTELGELTQAEAARREGITVSGMKSRVQRARRELAQVLARCCELTLDARGLPVDYRPRRDASTC